MMTTRVLLLATPFAVMIAGVVASLGATGCSDDSTPDATQKYIADPVQLDAFQQLPDGGFAAATWTNQPIQVENQNGSVILNPVAGLTAITATATPFAFADNQNDATTTIDQLVPNINILLISGVFHVTCGEGQAVNGTSVPGESGCDSLTVNVPAGTSSAPVDITAKADNGTLTTTGPITGSFAASSGNGEIIVDATPAPGSVISVTSQNGNVGLRLPADFSANIVTVTGKPADISAFPGLLDGKSHGTLGAGAKSITVDAPFGIAKLVVL